MCKQALFAHYPVAVQYSYEIVMGKVGNVKIYPYKKVPIRDAARVMKFTRSKRKKDIKINPAELLHKASSPLEK